ncbi:AAA family ATPase [Clostridium thermarum]|uniref:AAA family ATPase n=1 Tax=Clostridium thermarum TaxID=1716543 RepID=UPI001FADC798|nr:AAA family ATPase [Clostridium thermarum]
MQGLSGMVKNKLEPKDILYKIGVPKVKDEEICYTVPGYDGIIDKLKSFLSIDYEGYNIYIIDDYSKSKVDTIIEEAKKVFKDKNLKDICYVVMEDEKAPEALLLSCGMGSELKNSLEEIQNTYGEIVNNFYYGNIRQKDKIIKEIQSKKNELINSLFDIAKEEGFEVRLTKNGFNFMPIRDGEELSDSDYDSLDLKMKEEMLIKVSKLKDKARDILEVIKNEEHEGIQRIKEVLLQYLVEEINPCKSKCFCLFNNEEKALEYLKYVCENIEKNIVEIYSTSYDEDEEKINEAIYRYCVNVLVDNSEEDACNVIFEEDPTLNNLMGTIEYENHNGTYITDVNLIKAGSLLKANNGCLIMRASALFSTPSSYYYLRKALINGKVKFDHNKSYLELLTFNNLRPTPIDINVKIILLGDYETYEILYNMDDDFKRIFRVRLEYDSEIENNEINRRAIVKDIKVVSHMEGLMNFDDSAVREIFRFLSRKADSRKKLLYDEVELNRILITADRKARRLGKDTIKGEDIEESLYEKSLIENHLLESYKESRIILPMDERLVGSVNGLSVIDLGYSSFGRPLRITCTCYKGTGCIIDVQKESNLSGNIHNKAVSILTGLINKLFGGYSSIPVDFHLSFEQIYGKVEGDSASVAEIAAIISALTKLPIVQGIAVTGSINQFGEVQPIGGVNEKIEGFYEICKLKGSLKGKGVLLPKSNVDNIVLKPEVEAAVEKGLFNLYTMEKLDDALEVLMGDDKTKVEDIMAAAAKEIKKYTARNKNN